MSNAVRDFTVVRRRANFLDILTPKQEGIGYYQFKAATNFDGTFNTLFTAPIGSGYLDPNVNQSQIHAVNNPWHIRVIFDPATFGLTDTQHIWMQLVTLDYASTPVTTGVPHLILPDDEIRATGRVIIRGAAPNTGTVAGSLVLNLPNRMKDFFIRNNETGGGNNLFVATAIGGAERTVVPGETIEMKDGAQGCLLVRGSGGAVSFSADFTHYLPM